MKLGIISDIHQHPENIVLALEYFLTEQIDLIIGAGDISNGYRNLQQVIGFLAEAGLPTVLFPGSHEKLMEWQNVFQRTPNYIVDGLRQRKIPLAHFDLVILPGSEFLSGGEITLTAEGDSRLEAGKYLSSIDDLDSLVTNPNKTIIACHNPPKFRTPNGVDYAHYGENNRGILPGYDAAYYNLILTEKERISTHRKNRGYLPLAEKIALLFPERNEKVITAHFHESTQRVINRDEQPIPEMTWTKNLYHLASNLDFYRLGLWETRLNNGALEVRYKNIDLGNLG